MLIRRIVVVSNLLLFFTLQPAFAGVFFNDGFESGNLSYSTSSGAKWISGASTSVTNEKSYSGSYSLKFLYKGSSDLTKDSNAEQRFSLGTKKDEVYVRYYIYFPSNYTIRDPGGASNSKLFRLWGDDYTNRNKVGMSIASGQGTYMEAAIGNWPKELTCSGNMGAVPGGGWTLSSEYLGKWTSFEFHYKKDSGSGDGILQFYVNGALKIDLRNQSWVGAPCAPGYFLNGYLMGWSNSGFNQDTSVYIDDIIFSDQYIGPDNTSNAITSTPTTSQSPDIVEGFKLN